MEKVSDDEGEVICSGYFYCLFPRDDFKRNKEVERNLKTVIDE